MIQKVFLDTETCGYHGMPVLLQYAFDDGLINLYTPWDNPVNDTLRLIESFCECGVIGFNLAFDWFHITKLYTTLLLVEKKDRLPIDMVDEIAELEYDARMGPCLKPVSSMDLMLHARKGPYQSTMARSNIVVKRVPTALAYQLAAELEKRVHLPDIYFARKKTYAGKQWEVKDIEGVPEFKDIVMGFAASSALKALAVDALKIPVIKFDEIGVDKIYLPNEVGYAPIAKAIGEKGNWKGAWPEMIKHHHFHWALNRKARQYAADDVDYTRRLYEYFGSPELGDDDSILSCMVASVRWHGYKLNLEGIKKLKEDTLKKQYIEMGNEKFYIPTHAEYSRRFVAQMMDETEQVVSEIKNTTNKVVLDKISKWKTDCGCNKEQDCNKCDNTRAVPHPAAERARKVLDARQAQYEHNFYEKLLQAGRFHPSLAVIGALSSRMGGGGSSKGIEGGGFAGGDGLNAQGVKKTKEVRSQFPLADDGYDLCGGDFAAYEVTLAAAEYGDEALDAQLLTCEECEGKMHLIVDTASPLEYLGLEGFERYVKMRLGQEDKELKKAQKKNKKYVPKTEEQVRSEILENNFFCEHCGNCNGKKIHAVFGASVFPEFDYHGIKATEGQKDDKYTKSKSAVFTMIYGGTEYSLMERLGVEREAALIGMARFHKQFPGVKKAQETIVEAHKALSQHGGIGGKISYKEPAEYVETMFGFRRYFSLENKIAKTLYDLATKPPISWRDVKIKVVRRDREQSASGAVQSAIYAAAFQMQGNNTRAAINHRIQSAGATVTKSLQRKVWDIQPAGVHKFRVIPLNIHDELMCPTLPEYVNDVAKIVRTTVESYRPKVPLIKMDWVKKLGTWADKG